MAEAKQYITHAQNGGNVMISEDVVSTIVENTLTEVDGVVKGGAEVVGKKSWGKGIRIHIAEDNTLTIGCNIIVRYGESVIQVAKAVQEAEEAVAAAKPAGGKITSTDKDHNFIAGKVPMTTKKLTRIAKAKNMRQKIETYTPEDRAAMAAQLRELIEASQKLVDLIESV